MSEKYLYEITKYPKIFQNTYWGKNYAKDTDKEIINNRNLFVEEFRIKMKCRSYFFTNLYSRGDLNIDHPEIYRTKSRQIVFIFSNYKGNNPADIVEDMGFKKYMPLYLKGADTFICLFENEYEVKSLIQDINTRLFGSFFARKRKRFIGDIKTFCDFTRADKKSIEQIECDFIIPETEEEVLKYAKLLRLEKNSFEWKYFFRLAGF